ncbi:MFS transporter [Sphingomonas sp. DT-51]|uniref:MFS transporter n=1 Tax=Sphingomonas sp. DT-51 TaxID=3396165 RepID=UPI003F1BD6D0
MSDARIAFPRDEPGPLSHSVFRALWIAGVASNVGTWMQDAGSGWLMTSLTSSPLLVALIQVATTMPIFLFALPAGALADIVDRRRLLIASQILAVGAAASLALVTALGLTGALSLLCAASVLGLAAGLSGPAFQAITPELVPASVLPRAIALNSVGVNISRAVGPALGGLTIAAFGPAAVFAANAVLTASVAVVLFRWRREAGRSALPPERFSGAVVAGLRYARSAPLLRAVLIRTFATFLFSSALLALLPLVGRISLGLDASRYGLLLGAMGLGALLVALTLRRRLAAAAPDTLLGVGSIVLGLAMMGVAHSRGLALACCAMALAGGAWIVILTTLNGAAQNATAGWVRARSLAVYLVFFQGAMALGALLWGSVASHLGVATAITIAAVGLVTTIPLRFTLPISEHPDLTPAADWHMPPVRIDAAAERGPVMITIEYIIDPARLSEFWVAARHLELARRRDGAFEWGVFEDTTAPGTVVEMFLVASWTEHLRQHERRTRDDVPVQSAVMGFHVGAEPPILRHFVAPRST